MTKSKTSQKKKREKKQEKEESPSKEIIEEIVEEDLGGMDDSLISEDLLEEEDLQIEEENIPSLLLDSDMSIRNADFNLETQIYSKTPNGDFEGKEIEFVEKFFGEHDLNKDTENLSSVIEGKSLEDVWKHEDSLSIEQRRKRYHTNFVELSAISTWKKDSEGVSQENEPIFSFDLELNEKVALWQGDITTLELDAIVNAANETLLGGGGVDGAIHRSAGTQLLEECRQLGGCATGLTKITRGHDLPAKHVLHTVGPIAEDSNLLRSCYSSCLQLVKKYNIRTLAFCGISTGIFGYPLEAASRIALDTVRKWLETDDNRSKVDLIVFCTYLDREREMYRKLLPEYFPVGSPKAKIPNQKSVQSTIENERKNREMQEEEVVDKKIETMEKPSEITGKSATQEDQENYYFSFTTVVGTIAIGAVISFGLYRYFRK